MCGRYTLRANLNAILSEFHAIPAEAFEWTPNVDIRPTTQVPVVRMAGGQRELLRMRWGLIPPWEKEPKTKLTTFNARAETVAEKPLFRSSFKRRRCLVVADGYDEWQVVGGTEKKPVKQRQHIAFKNGRLFGMAGLWEHWERDGQVCESCTIIVTSANAELSHIHDRMPVILSPEQHDLWLDPEFESKDGLLAMLTPYRLGEIASTPT